MRLGQISIVAILIFVFIVDYILDLWYMYLFTMFIYSLGLLIHTFKDDITIVFDDGNTVKDSNKEVTTIITTPKKEITRFY